MSRELTSNPVPSLIQGISQQALHSRAASSAEDQKNCVNSTLDGLMARFGSTVDGVTTTKFINPFVHEIRRSKQEHYVVMMEDGVLEIYNLYDGSKATITGDISTYLASSEDGFRAYEAVSIEDRSLAVNRSTVVAMDAAKTDVRDNLAIAHFKSGNYSTTYTLTVTVATTDFVATYKTPDNSVSGNADFIATNVLSQTFTDAFNTTVVPLLDAAGHTGFTATKIGSMVLIDGDTNEFSVASEDGIGGKAFISFTDFVKKFSDLPAGAVDGFQVRVSGESKTESDDYYLTYSGTHNSGSWKETVAPDTQTSLDATAMPHVITNTGVNTFDVGPATWGDRLAGDGVLNAPDPSFVGRAIRDINFVGGRLVTITEANIHLSKALNAYVFFPDTAQTILDSAPIDFDVANGKVTIPTRTVLVGEKLQVWADQIQLALDSGNDPIREDTVDPKAVSNYEYEGSVSPKTVGTGSAIFTSVVNDHSLVTQSFYRGGKPSGEIQTNAHCPKLIKGEARVLNVENTSSIAVILGEDDRTKLYVYQWFNQGEDRVQSAWNVWDWPAAEGIVWVTVSKGYLHVILQWANNCTVEKIALDSVGPEPEATFPMRLDHRVTESSSVWEAGTGTHLVTLPFAVTSLEQKALFTCSISETVDDDNRRGKNLIIQFISDTQVRVSTGLEDLKFNLGVIPIAYSELSRLLVKGEKGVLYTERILIEKLYVGYFETTAFKVQLNYDKIDDRVEDFKPRQLGDTEYTNLDVPQRTGFMPVRVGALQDEVTITLLNDTQFVSKWQSIEYASKITKRER